MKFAILACSLLISFTSFCQGYNKSTFSFTSNETSNQDVLFSSGQVSQGIINSTIFLGYLPTSHTYLGLDQNKPNSISCYPNPFNDYLTLQLFDQNDLYSIDIYSSNGNLVFADETTNYQTSSKTLDLTYLAPGIYYIKFSSNSQITTKKIIKS